MRHALKPLKNDNVKLPKFVVCDIETANWTKFLCIGLYDGKTFTYFTRLKTFLECLFFDFDKVDVYAHFGGKFDFLFILKEALKDEKIKIGEIIPRGSGMLCFDLEKNGRIISFRDSSAILPFSLRTLTTDFNVTHKKQEIDYAKITKVTPKLIEYLEYDCKGLYESIEKFHQWDLVKRSGPRSTIASQALQVLKLYLKEDVAYLSKSEDKEIRDAYLGGRVEIFKPVYKGKRPLYCYDVNSLYPFVMRNNVFPNRMSSTTDTLEKNRLGIYEAEVTAPDNLYLPCLGVIRDGKYIFPTGTFKGKWTSAELLYAKTQKYKIKIIWGWTFTSGGYIFKDFIDELYKIKEKADRQSVDYVMAKLLMNSCYGRFGLNLDREVIVFDDGQSGVTELESNSEIKVGNKTYRLVRRAKHVESFSNVGIAAFVTSYARIHMHKLLSKCGREIYYTDTDSLFTTRKLSVSKRLGGLKEEYRCKDAVFILPKTYKAGEKTVMKGFDKKKIGNFSIEDFMSCLEGESRLQIETESKFATLKTALRQGDLTSMTKASTRKINAKYDKRITIIKNGKYDTIPLTLGVN